MGTYLGKIPIGVVLGAGSSVDNELWFILNGTYLLEKDVIALLNGNYNLKKEN
jgi:hypothetical protein